MVQKKLFGCHPSNECYTQEAAAAAAEEQDAEGIHDQEGDEREEVGNRVTAGRSIVSSAPHIVTIVLEHPHTSNNDPDEEKQRDQALQTAATFPSIVPVLFFIPVRSLLPAELATALEEVDGGLDQAEGPKHNQPDGDPIGTFTVIKIDGTWTVICKT